MRARLGAALVTNAGQHEELGFLCIPSLPSQADIVVVAKRPTLSINYPAGATETPLSLCSSKPQDKVAQRQWHCSDLTAGTR